MNYGLNKGCNGQRTLLSVHFLFGPTHLHTSCRCTGGWSWGLQRPGLSPEVVHIRSPSFTPGQSLSIVPGTLQCDREPPWVHLSSSFGCQGLQWGRPQLLCSVDQIIWSEKRCPHTPSQTSIHKTFILVIPSTELSWSSTRVVRNQQVVKETHPPIVNLWSVDTFCILL